MEVAIIEEIDRLYVREIRGIRRLYARLRDASEVHLGTEEAVRNLAEYTTDNKRRSSAVARRTLEIIGRENLSWFLSLPTRTIRSHLDGNGGE